MTVNNDEAPRRSPSCAPASTTWASDVPLVGDFHYKRHLLLRRYPAAPRRSTSTASTRATSAASARRELPHDRAGRVDHGKPVRIGVNWGSLDQGLLTQMMDANARAAGPRDAKDVYIEAMLESALRSARWRRRRGCARPHPHLGEGQRGARPGGGLPPAGRALRLPAATSASPRRGSAPRAWSPARRGSRSCSAEGIGDTIRVSLTPKPDGDRTEEVQVAQQILQSLGLRSFAPQVTACPGCGRTTSTFFQHMAEDIQTYLREQMPVWSERTPGVVEMKVGGDGLRGERPGREQARQHRHLAARHVRGAEGAGVRGRRAVHDAQGRPHRRRVPEILEATWRARTGAPGGAGGRLRRRAAR
jgi:(E)-4-hydroxy-3-methylbut-2-enyl-diphosphate synthase